MKTVSDRRYTEACNPLASYWNFFARFDFERDNWLTSDYLSLCLLCSCLECEKVKSLTVSLLSKVGRL